MYSKTMYTLPFSRLKSVAVTVTQESNKKLVEKKNQKQYKKKNQTGKTSAEDNLKEKNVTSCVNNFFDVKNVLVV